MSFTYLTTSTLFPLIPDHDYALHGSPEHEHNALQSLKNHSKEHQVEEPACLTPHLASHHNALQQHHSHTG